MPMSWPHRSPTERSSASSLTLDGADALVGAAVCAYEQAAGGAHLPRHAWAVQVLVENVMAQLSESPWLDGLTAAMWDEHRGVTERAVDRSMSRLTRVGWLVPVGRGRGAVWLVTETGRTQARLTALSSADREALAEAAQRALATTDAWLKNFRA